MSFIEVPNLPEKPVSLAAVDERISPESCAVLEGLGVSLIKIQRHPCLYGAVSSHPDMLLHPVGGDLIVHAPGISDELGVLLARAGFRLIKGAAELSPEYPRDIAYNAARIGRFYFHNLKYTDSVLRKELEKAGVEPVHVEQGYTKCSVALVDENTMITSDKGIARTAEGKGIDALLIDPGQGILLPGLDYGFIGGATGLLGKHRLAVNGAADGLKSFEAIRSLLFSKNGALHSLSGLPVTDIGSILPLMTY